MAETEVDLKIKIIKYEERIRNLETCSKITSLLTQELELEPLLDNIMKTAKSVMKADASSVLLMDEGGQTLSFIAAESAVGGQLKVARKIKVGEGIAGSVAKSGKPIVIEDAYTHPQFNPDYDKKTGFKTGSLICAPLKSRGKIIGVCQVIHGKDKGRVFTVEDQVLFQTVCDGAALAIQNSLSIRNIVETRQVERDLDFAQSVQQGFLPSQLPKHDNFAFAAKMTPARVVGGDFYDFITIDSRYLAIVAGDVAGKGVSAALHMARLMSDFRFLALADPEPGKVLSSANELLCGRVKDGMFTTALYLLIDLKKLRIKVGNAGHPPMVLKTAKGEILGIGKNGGPPLGIMPNLKYKEEEIELNSGDRALIYTDGLTEAKDQNNEHFGMKKLYVILKKFDKGPRELLIELENALRSHTGAAPQNDDWTFVAFQAL
jgi:sigma-B regulation protein RsbU (phosphoserine phosphatase)